MRHGEVFRSDLALMRTRLALERTFLAYIRLGLGLFATGIASIRFLHGPTAVTLGWILITLSAVAVVFGLLRYRNVARSLAEPAETAPNGQSNSAGGGPAGT